MTAKAGEIARETANYSCQKCGGTNSVQNGAPIAGCPDCGNDSFVTGSRTLRNQPSLASPLEGFGSFQ
jgi:DNA-directed RNA polymerase subunit RPC12/RpoP